jgi:pimeloyl-ACP methyl ester carboxylesterase
VTRLPATLRRVLPALWLALALLAVWQLERARSGLEISRFTVGTTPATFYALPGADGPAVVVAHGFAGSRQLMEAWSLTLARAGYRVLAFDYEGHGRNPVPMTGDVTAVDGTTRLLVDETLKLARAARSLPGQDAPVALIGHSMATDIIIRASGAAEPGLIGPVVAISAFSQAVTADHPPNLLLITGQGEGALRGFAIEALGMVEPGATEGTTVAEGTVTRRAVVAPLTEHVTVLWSETGLREARAWLDTAYGRASDARVADTGGWLLLLLASIVALAAPLARLLPDLAENRRRLSAGRFAVILILPALAAPVLAQLAPRGWLPVLVADYLMVHLALYGAIQLALLAFWGVRLMRLSPIATLALGAFGIGVFGLALDRYGASFWPTGDRWTIIAVLALGAIPFMVADALVTRGGREGIWRRILARMAFLGSLALAVGLDFERLFFLFIIAPVIVLYFLTMGLMGRWVARRSGAVSAGVALGVILAWSLGVSFPLFSQVAG